MILRYLTTRKNKEIQFQADSKKIDFSSYLGIGLVLLFLFLANANAVFAGNLLQTIHPFIFLFWSFLSCSIFFLIRQNLIESDSQQISRKELISISILNVTTAVNWIGFYFALKFVEPAVVSAIMGGIGPLLMIGLERVLHKKTHSLSVYMASLGILAGAALLFWASLTGNSGIEAVSSSSMAIGLIAAFIGGNSQALNTLATKQLGNHKWSSDRIMAHRFYLLTICAFVLSISGPGLTVPLSFEILGLILSTIFGIIIPLWVLQRGILMSEPYIVAVLLSLAPIVTYVFQGLDNRVSWSMVSLSGCVIIVVFTIVSVQIKRKVTNNE